MRTFTVYLPLYFYHAYDPGKHCNSLFIIHGAIWTKEPLADSVAFKDNWPHDLHDLAERHLTFYFEYNFWTLKGNEPRSH